MHEPNSPRVIDTGDPAQTAAARAFERYEDLQVRRDLVSVMESTAGRRVLWWILKKVARIDLQSFVRDSDMSAFNDGRRSCGLELQKQINKADPAAFGNMAVEAAHNMETNNA